MTQVQAAVAKTPVSSDDEWSRRSREDMEHENASEIARSGNIPALRHVVLAVRHHPDHETGFREVAVKAAKKLLELRRKHKSYEDFNKSVRIIEVSLPGEKVLKDKIRNIHTPWLR